MRANFEDAYRELPPAAARLLRLLSLPPGDGIGPAAAAALADVPETEARALLELLAERGLVTASDGRFRLPGPVCDRARERALREESESSRRAALRRLLDHALAPASDGEGGGEADGEGAQGPALLDRERWSEATDVLRERLDRAEEGGDPRAVLWARHDLARALMGAGDLDGAIELLGLLPDGFAALPEPDHRGRVRALTALGEAHLRVRRPVAATNFFGQALDTLRKHGTRDEQAAMFVKLADAACQRADDAAEAAALACAALLARGEDPWPPGRPVSLPCGGPS